MATAIENRIRRLELRKPSAIRQVLRIVCKGATPTPEEQARIDAASDKGIYVIVRLIVKPPQRSEVPHGNA